MKTIEQKIKAFSENEETTMESVALLKVAVEKGNDLHKAMQLVAASILFKFHGIPLTPNG